MRVAGSVATTLVVVATAVFALSACGQKGPLVLPAKPATSAASTPASAPGSR
jgi:predicted small lipoprotein YifL